MSTRDEMSDEEYEQCIRLGLAAMAADPMDAVVAAIERVSASLPPNPKAGCTAERNAACASIRREALRLIDTSIAP